MISYEVAMGISVVGVFMIYGTLRLTDMGGRPGQELFRVFGFVEHFGWVDPAGHVLGRLPSCCPCGGSCCSPSRFFMFLTCIMAENKRPPFDLPEAETPNSWPATSPSTRACASACSTWRSSSRSSSLPGLMTSLFLGGWSDSDACRPSMTSDRRSRIGLHR